MFFYWHSPNLPQNICLLPRPNLFTGNGIVLANTKRLAFFEKDFIDWEGEVELKDFYKTLLCIRKKNKALQESASVLILDSHHPDVLVYLCRRQQDKVLVLLNFSKEKASFYSDHPAIAGHYLDLFTGEKIEAGRKQRYSFKGGQYAVYHLTMAV